MNTEVADNAMSWILQHPERHDQFDYAVDYDDGCGTTFCFAGVICVQAGWQPLFRGPSGVASHFTRPDDDWPVFAFEIARGLLGITNREAMHLFHAPDLIELQRRLDDLR